MAVSLRRHTAPAGWRRIVVPGLEDDVVELTAALESTLLALAGPVDWPDGTFEHVDLRADDAQTLEIVSAGAHGLALIRLLVQRAPALDVHGHDAAPLPPMRLVDVPANCVDALSAAVDVLTAARDTGQPGIVADGLRAAADHLRTTPTTLVELAVRALRLWDAPWTDDHELVADALARVHAGTPVVLSPREDIACRRLLALLHAAWQLGHDAASGVGDAGNRSPDGASPARSRARVDADEGPRRFEE